MNYQTVFSAQEVNEQLHEYVQHIRLVAIDLRATLAYMSLTVLKMRASLGIMIDSQVAVE